MSGVTDITAFISARLDEDEQAAKAPVDPKWRIDERETRTLEIYTGPGSQGWAFGGGSGMWACDDPEDDCEMYRSTAYSEAEHITRHDPARVLAQVAAMRAIVAAACVTIDIYDSGTVLDLAWTTLRHLAAIWSDHGHYDPAWAPEGE